MKKTLLLTILLFLTLTACGKKEETTIDIPTNQLQPIKVPYKDFYNSGKSLNDDFVGYLHFESGLISQPVVQGQTNDTYSRKDWITGEYDLYGSIFMDYENTLSDQNLIIYGHYVYKHLDDSGTLKFTPLSQLLEPENYDNNKTIYLLLENEVRKYEIVSVYLCPLSEDYMYTDENLQYNLPNYSDDYFGKYKTAVISAQRYVTGVNWNKSDKLLTLQTCVEGREDLREIVIARQIDTLSVDDSYVESLVDKLGGVS